MNQNVKLLLSTPVLVAALGYFVDTYDLLLFSIVRTDSLTDLGYSGASLMDQGIFLINVQMVGMLVGGILWGIMGDKKGRLSVLFGSILLYSLANIANGFVQTGNQYAWLRFIAGIGLAGELGAGITLVAEMLPQKIRGYGTSLVAALGLLGAVLANIMAENFHWRTTYFIGGGLGLALLTMRVGIMESSIFKKIKHSELARGDFFSLFRKRETFLKYLNCILIGLPIWFVIGILITFSPEFSMSKGIENVSAGRSVMFGYIGLSAGDIASGLLSQYFKSRKKAVLLFLMLTSISVLIYLYYPVSSATGVYIIAGLLGFSIGYWALFVTIAAEQFGTNLRSTSATTVPNFIRASVVPTSFLFLYLKKSWNISTAALFTGGLCMMIAFTALFFLAETFHRSMDFTEETNKTTV